MPTMIKRILPAAVAMLICAGCVSLDSLPEDRRFFTLSAPRPDAVEMAGTGRQLEVRIRGISDYLQSTRMVVRLSPVELRFSDRHRWADALKDSFARLVAETLRQNLPGDVNVSVVPMRTASADIVTIDIALVACEGESAGNAVLEADWLVWEGASTIPAASGVFRQSAGGWETTDYAQLATLLAGLSRDFANTLAEPVGSILSAEPSGEPTD